MKSYKKQAFSLTELLIVLVVVAILFAALAPILTKRRHGSTTGYEPIWMFVSNDDQKDAYYDPGMHEATSAAYVGFKPSTISRPYAKVILKASNDNQKPQNMIQFRYGSGNGTLSGIFFADTNGNYINTNRLGGTTKFNYNDAILNSNTRFNTILGADAFSKVTEANSAVAIGAGALSNGNKPNLTTVVGSGSGKYAASSNVILGANTALGENITNNVIAGANVMSVKESQGSKNVVAGSNVAVAGLKNTNNSLVETGYNSTDGNFLSEKNVLIGARTIRADYLNNSTIIGSGAYTGAGFMKGSGAKKYTVAKDLTAIGYNTCSSMELAMPNGGARTCIGPTSGQATNSSPTAFNTDKYDHIFLGGAPIGGFGGRSVLEVHNVDTSHSITGVLPNVGPTVVLNSHLVVRGNTYFPRVTDGALVAHGSFGLIYGDVRQNRDWCSKGCCIRLWRRWKCSEWREKNGCNIVAELFDWMVNPFVKIIFETFGFNLGKWGVIFGNFDGFKASNGGRQMAKEPLSNSAMYFFVGNDNNCSSSSYCPSLKTSDIRLKENISENTDSLNKLLNISPYNYTYKSDLKKLPQVGVIAQDLRNYMPNSVSTNKDGFLQIRWDEMFFTTINSIKALDKKVVKLAIETDELEKDTKQLVNEQKSVKTRIDSINKRLNKLEK